MPLATLKALSTHHADLKQHLPTDDASETVRRIGLVTVLLPRFAMACVTEEEAAAAATQREELEAIKKERAQLEAEEAAETAKAATAAEESATPGAKAAEDNATPGQPGQPADRKQGDSDAGGSGVLV